ncbi:hypothetical protein BpHYR1_050783 [Brachionus plicatilis]|uniref:Uncharacterized protein n=1 Tax=Brachionus plicatilis TaxID=10195 RepID=A0A3M7PWG9_BRAPC|nr:hypothetical protein BpHYR1_050783 [Brachionus plicatilis]
MALLQPTVVHFFKWMVISFCSWRTKRHNNALESKDNVIKTDDTLRERIAVGHETKIKQIMFNNV